MKRGIRIWPALSVFLWGCNFQDLKQGPNAVSAQQLSSYQALEANIFQPKCARCHSGAGAAGGLDLTNYQALLAKPGVVVSGQPNQSSLYTEVASGDMPDGGPPLSAVEISSIGDWISSGAPNGDFSAPTEQPTNPTLTPTPSPVASATYTQVQTNIFNAYCTRCHSGAHPSGQIDLSSYSALMASRGGALVIAGQPGQSTLYNEVSRGSMPPRGPTLSSNLQTLLHDWILKGALND